MNLLDIVILLPLVGFLVTLLLPRSNPSLIRTFTVALALITFVVSIGLVLGFNSEGVNGNAGSLQFEHNFVWIDNPQIHYHVGIDGISLWLIMLSTLLTPICIMVSWRSIKDRPKEFYAFLLLLEFGLVGVFAAYDLFLFYVFWEVSLVPMYFLIGIWGHDRRIYAAVKFFLYTMAGSSLMLVAIVYLYLRMGGSFDYASILGAIQSGRTPLTSTEELWLFLAFFIAFAIKVPLFPLHTWLPDAHVEAPTAGSIMLASVMLKMGTYGLVRFCVPMFPNAAKTCSVWIIPLAITGIVYGALVAMIQPNMKKLVAYSSVSHLGFVVLGVFSLTQLGMDGAVYQMLNHGISTGALFLLVGLLYERRHSLEIKDYGGVATVAPWLATIFLITTLSSVGLPTLNNFVGEFLVLQGSAQANFLWTVCASLGPILSACYMLWLYQRVFYGKVGEEVEHHIPELTGREWACMVPLIVLMVWMGTYTQTFLTPVTKATARLLEQANSTATMRVNAAVKAPDSLRGSGGALHAH
jgi:NADH-quinone oxidoreductase subunit M